MALSAYVGRPLRLEPQRLYGCRVRPTKMKRIAPPRRAIHLCVLGAWTVTRFAGNPKLYGCRVNCLHQDRLRSERRVEFRLAIRGMAGDTDAVPASGLRNRPQRGMQQDRLARHPSPFPDQIGCRELAEQA